MATLSIADSERLLICAMLQSEKVFHSCDIDEGDFTEILHQRMYIGIKSEYARGEKINLVTAKQYGIDPIAFASFDLPTATNYGFYLNIIHEASLRRKLERLPDKIKSLLSDSKDNATVLVNIEKILNEAELGSKHARVMKMDDVVRSYSEELETRILAGGGLPGIPTGYRKLDEYMGGLQKQHFIVIAARPSVGKSAFMCNMALNIAKQKETIGIITLESSVRALLNRIMAIETGVEAKKIRNAEIGEAILPSIVNAYGRLAAMPIYWYDRPGIDLPEILSVIRLMVKAYGVKAVFIDYLQLIRNFIPGTKRHEQIMEISMALKDAARIYNVPVVALAQCTRSAQGKEPELDDLADSSQIEKDAEAIIFLHREKTDTGFRHWILPYKVRDGRTGRILATFNSSILKLEESENERAMVRHRSREPEGVT